MAGNSTADAAIAVLRADPPTAGGKIEGGQEGETGGGHHAQTWILVQAVSWPHSGMPATPKAVKSMNRSPTTPSSRPDATPPSFVLQLAPSFIIRPHEEKGKKDGGTQALHPDEQHHQIVYNYCFNREEDDHMTIMVMMAAMLTSHRGPHHFQELQTGSARGT